MWRKAQEAHRRKAEEDRIKLAELQTRIAENESTPKDVERS
jgi:hypothetical protein